MHAYTCMPVSLYVLARRVYIYIYNIYTCSKLYTYFISVYVYAHMCM